MREGAFVETKEELAVYWMNDKPENIRIVRNYFLVHPNFIPTLANNYSYT